MLRRIWPRHAHGERAKRSPPSPRPLLPCCPPSSHTAGSPHKWPGPPTQPAVEQRKTSAYSHSRDQTTQGFRPSISHGSRGQSHTRHAPDTLGRRLCMLCGVLADLGCLVAALLPEQN
jgi:hypothetical protein